jgi:hypothetical protein
MIDDRVVDAGLLTRGDLHRLGQSFVQAWPVDRNSGFDGLLRAIDEAEQDLSREPDKPGKVA